MVYRALSRAHGVAASIDRQVDSSDVAGSVGGQEGDAVGHLLHLPGPTQGVGQLTPGQKLETTTMLWVT